MIGMETTNRTLAATQARMRSSESKMATRLIERGWFCDRTGFETWLLQSQRAGMQIYATNGLRETYRVIGWDDADGTVRPIFLGDEGQWVGLQDYLFTAGPK